MLFLSFGAPPFIFVTLFTEVYFEAPRFKITLYLLFPVFFVAYLIVFTEKELVYPEGLISISLLPISIEFAFL